MKNGLLVSSASQDVKRIWGLSGSFIQAVKAMLRVVCTDINI